MITMERLQINIKNKEQTKFLLIKYIMLGDIESTKNITKEMYMNGLSKEIFDTCIEIFIYNCCIYIPEYITLILSYEQNINYYYKLVLHLILAPKRNIFEHFPDHRNMYFYLLLIPQLENKPLEDNKKELEIEFDKYYKSISYYMQNINVEYQLNINEDFSNILYYLYFDNDYINYSKNIWNVQFNLYKEENLLEYIRKFNVLEDYVESKKLKILILYYTLQFRFLDISSILYIYQDNDKKINEILSPKIIHNYLSPKRD